MVKLIAGGVCLAVILGFAAIILAHNLRIRRVRKTHRRIPEEVKQRVLDLIREAASRGPQVTVWRRGASSNETPEEWIDQSHLGGAPYAERGESWPEGEAPEDGPPKFVVQLRIGDDEPGEVWRDRLIVVYMRFDDEQIVRSYPRASRSSYSALTSPGQPLQFVELWPLPMPIAVAEESDDDSVYPATPEELVQRVPEIAAELQPYTRDAAGALTQILRGGHYGYSLDTCDIAYSGGTPGLIQNEHDAVCKVCEGEMRFLFQFGEMFEDMRLADGGVVYVYGCDRHPDCCRAWIDSC